MGKTTIYPLVYSTPREIENEGKNQHNFLEFIVYWWQQPRS